MAVFPSDIKLELELTTNVWTDVWDDVLTYERFELRYGITVNRPDVFVASPGSMDFSLDNSSNNSGGVAGYYSPNSSNVRSGFDQGINVRLGVTYDSDTHYKFRGRLKRIDPDAGKFSSLRAVCRAGDWISDSVKIRPERLDVQTDQRGDQLLTTALASINNQPASTSFDEGKSTFSYSFDEIRDSKTTMHQILKNIAGSEFGRIYEIGDTDTGGVLVFEHRHHRITDTDILISMDDDGDSDDFSEIYVIEDEEAIFNDVSGTVYPRIVDTNAADQVLWTMQGDPQTIAAGETFTIVGRYTDSDNPGSLIAGIDIITPTSDDFDWSGNDSDLSKTYDIGGNSTKFTFENTGNVSGTISELKIRGKRVVVYEPELLESRDSDSISDHGVRQLSHLMRYQENRNQGQSFIDTIVSRWKDAKLRIKTVNFSPNQNDLKMKAALVGEPGMKINLSESIAGIDRVCVIEGVQLFLSAGDMMQCSWFVSEADDTAYFTVNVSEIDGSHLLGF